jgi:hypothetical protein
MEASLGEGVSGFALLFFEMERVAAPLKRV